uniref:SHR-BD domain-containing protein n=1 Tax=Macrostomum lignano TaxID=282301 RepID=A0A1I8GWC9_9PLAT
AQNLYQLVHYLLDSPEGDRAADAGTTGSHSATLQHQLPEVARLKPLIWLVVTFHHKLCRLFVHVRLDDCRRLDALLPHGHESLLVNHQTLLRPSGINIVPSSLFETHYQTYSTIGASVAFPVGQPQALLVEDMIVLSGVHFHGVVVVHADGGSQVSLGCRLPAEGRAAAFSLALPLLLLSSCLRCVGLPRLLLLWRCQHRRLTHGRQVVIVVLLLTFIFFRLLFLPDRFSFAFQFFLWSGFVTAQTVRIDALLLGRAVHQNLLGLSSRGVWRQKSPGEPVVVAAAASHSRSSLSNSTSDELTDRPPPEAAASPLDEDFFQAPTDACRCAWNHLLPLGEPHWLNDRRKDALVNNHRLLIRLLYFRIFFFNFSSFEQITSELHEVTFSEHLSGQSSLLKLRDIEMSVASSSLPAGCRACSVSLSHVSAPASAALTRMKPLSSWQAALPKCSVVAEVSIPAPSLPVPAAPPPPVTLIPELGISLDLDASWLNEDVLRASSDCEVVAEAVAICTFASGGRERWMTESNDSGVGDGGAEPGDAGDAAMLAAAAAAAGSCGDACGCIDCCVSAPKAVRLLEVRSVCRLYMHFRNLLFGMSRLFMHFRNLLFGMYRLFMHFRNLLFGMSWLFMHFRSFLFGMSRLFMHFRSFLFGMSWLFMRNFSNLLFGMSWLFMRNFSNLLFGNLLFGVSRLFMHFRNLLFGMSRLFMHFRNLLFGMSWLFLHFRNLLFGVSWLFVHFRNLLFGMSWLFMHFRNLLFGMSWLFMHFKSFLFGVSWLFMRNFSNLLFGLYRLLLGDLRHALSQRRCCHCTCSSAVATSSRKLLASTGLCTGLSSFSSMREYAYSAETSRENAAAPACWALVKSSLAGLTSSSGRIPPSWNRPRPIGSSSGLKKAGFPADGVSSSSSSSPSVAEADDADEALSKKTSSEASATSASAACWKLMTADGVSSTGVGASEPVSAPDMERVSSEIDFSSTWGVASGAFSASSMLTCRISLRRLSSNSMLRSISEFNECRRVASPGDSAGAGTTSAALSEASSIADATGSCVDQARGSATGEHTARPELQALRVPLSVALGLESSSGVEEDVTVAVPDADADAASMRASRQASSDEDGSSAPNRVSSLAPVVMSVKSAETADEAVVDRSAELSVRSRRRRSRGRCESGVAQVPESSRASEAADLWDRLCLWRRVHLGLHLADRLWYINNFFWRSSLRRHRLIGTSVQPGQQLLHRVESLLCSLLRRAGPLSWRAVRLPPRRRCTIELRRASDPRPQPVRAHLRTPLAQQHPMLPAAPALQPLKSEVRCSPAGPIPECRLPQSSRRSSAARPGRRRVQRPAGRRRGVERRRTAAAVAGAAAGDRTDREARPPHGRRSDCLNLLSTTADRRGFQLRAIPPSARSPAPSPEFCPPVDCCESRPCIDFGLHLKAKHIWLEAAKSSLIRGTAAASLYSLPAISAASAGRSVCDAPNPDADAADGSGRAPSGNTDWTRPLARLAPITPPSGPIRAASCRSRVTKAKYCGRLAVRMRTMRLWRSSSLLSNGLPKKPPMTSSTACSEASRACSFQVSPVSDLTEFLSAAMCGTSSSTGLAKLRQLQPNSRIRQARPSPSFSCGGRLTRPGRSRRHVTRVGPVAAFGGTTMRRPGQRAPVMAPPRASTRNETRNLEALGTPWTACCLGGHERPLSPEGSGNGTTLSSFLRNRGAVLMRQEQLEFLKGSKREMWSLGKMEGSARFEVRRLLGMQIHARQRNSPGHNGQPLRRCVVLPGGYSGCGGGLRAARQSQRTQLLRLLVLAGIGAGLHHVQDGRVLLEIFPAPPDSRTLGGDENIGDGGIEVTSKGSAGRVRREEECAPGCCHRRCYGAPRRLRGGRGSGRAEPACGRAERAGLNPSCQQRQHELQVALLRCQVQRRGAAGVVPRRGRGAVAKQEARGLVNSGATVHQQVAQLRVALLRRQVQRSEAALGGGDSSAGGSGVQQASGEVDGAPSGCDVHRRVAVAGGAQSAGTGLECSGVRPFRPRAFASALTAEAGPERLVVVSSSCRMTPARSYFAAVCNGVAPRRVAA